MTAVGVAQRGIAATFHLQGQMGATAPRSDQLHLDPLRFNIRQRDTTQTLRTYSSSRVDISPSSVYL